MAKGNTRVIAGSLLSVFAVVLVVASGVRPSFAEESNVTFQVNVKESLSVTITQPIEPASGGVNDFLRNDYSVSVNSNNANGFTASMYAKDNTYLSSGSNQLQTLSATSTVAAFPVDRWGYSLDATSYSPLTNSTTNPITLISAAAGTTSASQNFYFGAKSGYNTPSGTYKGTVVVSVVSGIIDDNTNPVTPVNPATPDVDNTPNDNNAAYTGNTGTGATQGVGSSGYTGTTVGRVTSTDSTAGTSSTTTQVSGGDNTAGYTDPQGEQYSTVANVQSSTFPAAALLATAGVTATTGVLFFVLAKRDDDDDDDDETPLES